MGVSAYSANVNAYMRLNVGIFDGAESTLACCLWTISTIGGVMSKKIGNRWLEFKIYILR
jgi:hypothetical protein